MKTQLTTSGQIEGWFPMRDCGDVDRYSEQEVRWFVGVGKPYNIDACDVINIWYFTGAGCAACEDVEDEDHASAALTYRNDKFDEVAALLGIGREIVEKIHDRIMAEMRRIMAELEKHAFPAEEPPTLKPKQIHWIWYPYLPGKMITLIGARGGTGKGLVCMSLAAAITGQEPWPDGQEQRTPGNVLWCEAEDPIEEVLVPRMLAAKVDQRRVIIRSRQDFEKIEDLGAFLMRNNVQLVVLSPLLSFLRGDFDKNDEMQVREVMEGLQKAATVSGAAIVGICHLTKKSDLVAIERILGSVAFANFVRSVMLAAPEKPPEQPEEGDKNRPDKFRLAHAKHNLSIRGKDLLYTPRSVGALHESDHRSQFVRVEWELAGENVDTDALFDRVKKGASDKAPSAGDVIYQYLKDHPECLGADAMEYGKKAGFSEGALRKAAYRDRRIAQEGGVWYLR